MNTITKLLSRSFLAFYLLLVGCGSSSQDGRDAGISDGGQDASSGGDENDEAEAAVRASLPTPEQIYQDLAASLDLRAHLWGDDTDGNLAKLQL